MRNYDVINGLDPKYNAFDLSHNHYTTMPFGYLMPVAWFECIPGDIHDLNMQALVRCMPLVAPIMNNITCEVDAYFVPYRLLDDNFEAFYTTVDPRSIPPKTYDKPLPTWCQFRTNLGNAPSTYLTKEVEFNNIGLLYDPSVGNINPDLILDNGNFAYVPLPITNTMAPPVEGYKWPPQLMNTQDGRVITDPKFFLNYVRANNTSLVTQCPSVNSNCTNVASRIATFKYTPLISDSEKFGYDGVTTTINTSTSLIKHVQKVYDYVNSSKSLTDAQKKEYKAVFDKLGCSYEKIPGSDSTRFVSTGLNDYIIEKYSLETVPIDKYAPTLWDCFGFSREFNFTDNINKIPSKVLPFDLFRRAYYFIYNEWYRDENLQRPIDFKNVNSTDSLLQWCVRSSWHKDYFTAAFYARQKGVAPAIPVTGTATVDFLLNGSTTASLPEQNVVVSRVYDTGTDAVFKLRAGGGGANWRNVGYEASTIVAGQNRDIYLYGKVDNPAQTDFINWLTSNNKVNPGKLISLDVADARDMFAIQRFFESLMRGGSRFIEMLQYQWNVSPSDARLSLPEHIGSTAFNIQISEVLQNSATNDVSPQGNQTGHGFSLTNPGDIGSYKAEEPGVIMFIARIMPPAIYSQRLPREVMRKSLLDQVNPHFVNLSYQGILESELYATGNPDEISGDPRIFAFQGRYDELREKLSYVSGDFYDTELQSYVIFRKFTNPPAFNSDFIACDPDEGDPFHNSIFVVTDEHPFLCNFYFNVKAMRKIPIVNFPSRLDHVYGE